MYKVIQNVEGKDPVLWCTTNEFEFLCQFCQYLLDSADPSGLDDFLVVWENDRTRNSKRRLLTYFCDVQGIRKRTFEERIL